MKRKQSEYEINSYKFASECQLAADNMARELLNASEEVSLLARFQSLCDFNIFWAYSISPEVVIHLNSIKLLLTGKIKRKLKLKELFYYDFLIQVYNPSTFTEFTKLVLK